MNELPGSRFASTAPMEVVAWEDTGQAFFARLWAQIEALTVRPVAAGRALRSPADSVWPSVSFATIAIAIAYAPLALCLPCALLALPIIASTLPPQIAALEGGLICGVFAGMPFFVVGGHLASDALFGVVFHGLARLAGGTGSFRDSIRVGFYARGTTVWLVLVWFLAWIPFLGTIIQLSFRALVLLWSTFTFYGAAQGVHGLGEDRGILVAIGTAVLGLVLLVTIGLLTGSLIVLAVFGSFAGLAATLPHLGP